MCEARILNLSYDLAKKVPDMRQRGVRIETAYGEIDLDEADSARVTDLVAKLLQRKLAAAEKEASHV